MGRAVRTRQPQFVIDVEEDPDFLRASYEVESEICVPLLKDQAVLGTLNVKSTSHRPLTETDLNLLITFGNQVVAAIANASLFEAEREQRKLAEALREVDEALSESLDFETLLDRLLEKIQRVVPYDTACIFLVDEKPSVRPGQAHARLRAFRRGCRTKRGLLRHRYHREPQLSENGGNQKAPDHSGYAADPDWIRVIPHIGSWAGAPIIVQNQIVAFFSLDKVETDFFRPEHAARLTAFCGQAAIVIENARLYAEVQRLAIQDELTGLYNRRGFYEIGRHEFERALRFKRSLCMLFLDVDEFKAFNNTYSYAVGDQVLRALGLCLKTHSREVDLVGRYGGDEFVILLPETDLGQAAQVAERLRQSVAAVRVPAGPAEVGFTVSIGVCQYAPHLVTLEGLIDCAGKNACKKPRRLGRNRIAFAHRYC